MGHMPLATTAEREDAQVCEYSEHINKPTQGHSSRFSFSAPLTSQLSAQKLSEVMTHYNSSGSGRACVRMSEQHNKGQAVLTGEPSIASTGDTGGNQTQGGCAQVKKFWQRAGKLPCLQIRCHTCFCTHSFSRTWPNLSISPSPCCFLITRVETF